MLRRGSLANPRRARPARNRRISRKLRMKIMLTIAVFALGACMLSAQSDVPIPTLPGPICTKKMKKSKESCVTPPRVISSPDPVYPRDAEIAHLQATVIVWLVVTEDGKPVDVRIKQAAGHGFDRAAYDCVRQWTFAPAMYEGKPISAIAEVEVHFRTH